MQQENKGALAGVRVLDLGTMVAGPVAATLMADFGAEVIKIEEPTRGDTLRHIGPFVEGEGLWWNVESRSKKSVTLDLRQAEGQRILKELVKSTDILIENFRPGTLERWNIGWKDLEQVNPRLVMLSISGYGQTGPYADRAGYDRIGLAFGGLLNISGFPDRPPVRPGTAVADYQSALYGAFAAMVALFNRDARGGKGQQIDLSLYEAVFRFTDIMVTAFDKIGLKRERQGNVHFAAAPGDHFETSDGRYIVLTVSSDGMYKRMCEAMQRIDLVDDARFRTHTQRAGNVTEINDIVGAWVKSMPVPDLCKLLDAHGLAYSIVFTVADILADPHYKARGTIMDLEHPRLGTLKMPAPQPLMSGTPAPAVRVAPTLGEHTDAVLRELVGLSTEQMAALRAAKVI